MKAFILWKRIITFLSNPLLLVTVMTAATAFITYRAVSVPGSSSLLQVVSWAGSVVVAVLMLPSYIVIAVWLADLVGSSKSSEYADKTMGEDYFTGNNQKRREYGPVGRGLESEFLAQDPATKRCMDNDCKLR